MHSVANHHPIINSLLQILSSSNSVDAIDNLEIFIVKLGSIFQRSDSQFNVNNQQDAEEILTGLLNHFDEEIVFHRNLFSLNITKTTTCSRCNTPSAVNDANTVLQLGIPTTYSSVTVKTCLDVDFEVQVLSGDNAFYCNICDIRITASQVLRTPFSPQVLFVSLKGTEQI